MCSSLATFDLCPAPDLAEIAMLNLLVKDAITEATQKGISNYKFHGFRIQAFRRDPIVVIQVTHIGKYSRRLMGDSCLA
jgi:hypothetical protein